MPCAKLNCWAPLVRPYPHPPRSAHWHPHCDRRAVAQTRNDPSGLRSAAESHFPAAAAKRSSGENVTFLIRMSFLNQVHALVVKTNGISFMGTQETRRTRKVLWSLLVLWSAMDKSLLACAVFHVSMQISGETKPEICIMNFLWWDSRYLEVVSTMSCGFIVIEYQLDWFGECRIFVDLSF